jgi:hypothetical protein
MKPHRGTLILVLGILGLICCPITGIISWIMGSADLKEMDAGRMDPAGRGNTRAGKICGIISVILLIAQVVLIVIAIAIFGSSLLAGIRAILQGQGTNLP